MTINKKIIAILAIFLLIASISAISAEENETETNGDDTAVDEELDDSEDDTTDDEEIDDVGDNPYRHGALTPNEKAFLEDGHASGENSNEVSAYGSPTTGNPILVLLAAMAILGVYPLSRKK